MNRFNKILILSIFYLSISFISCSKQETPEKQTKVIQQISDCKFVDPIKDLVAIYNPDKRTLFVIKEHQDSVLQLLGARQGKDNTFKMPALTSFKRAITINFAVTPVTFAQLLSYVPESQKKKIDSIANADTLRGKLDSTYEDVHGIWMRIYKDARCADLFSASETECIPGAAGTFFRIKYFAGGHCLKVDKYCEEALVVRSRCDYFRDSNCSQLFTSILNYDYMCVK